MRQIILTLCFIAGCLVLILFSVSVVYFLRVKMHIVFNFHPFDRDECNGEDMHFDAFICCAQTDVDIAKELLRFLEDEDYNVYFHLRDFEIGETIDVNIYRAIKISKRTLCLISENFVRSHYCMREFEVALHRNVELRKKRLIAVILEPVVEQLAGNDDEISASLQEYLKSHMYIDYNSYDYRQRLLYAMPVKRLQSTTRELVGGYNDKAATTDELMVTADPLLDQSTHIDIDNHLFPV